MEGYLDEESHRPINPGLGLGPGSRHVPLTLGIGRWGAVGAVGGGGVRWAAVGCGGVRWEAVVGGEVR